MVVVSKDLSVNKLHIQYLLRRRLLSWLNGKLAWEIDCWIKLDKHNLIVPHHIRHVRLVITIRNRQRLVG